MIQQSFNIFTSAIHEEIHDLINSYSGQESESAITESYTDQDGHILIPLNSDSFYIEHFTDYMTYRNDSEDDDEDDDELSGYAAYDILSQVQTENIMKINGTPAVLQDILLEMFQNKDSSIYGITVVDGEKRYNILHPITAYMIKSGEIVLPNEILIMIYSYQHNSKTIEVDHYINKISNILKTITNHGYKTKSTMLYQQRNNTVHKDISSANSFMDYNFTFDESGGTRPEFGILPVQFMTGDVSFPYYGVVASLTTGGSYQSINLTGMASGNINIEAEYREGNFVTCTGDHPNELFSSLFTLNDMNLHSLYNDHIVHDDNWHNWVFTCQMFSIYQMYSDVIDAQAAIVPEVEAIPEVEITPVNEPHTVMMSTDTASEPDITAWSTVTVPQEPENIVSQLNSFTNDLQNQLSQGAQNEQE